MEENTAPEPITEAVPTTQAPPPPEPVKDQTLQKKDKKFTKKQMVIIVSLAVTAVSLMIVILGLITSQKTAGTSGSSSFLSNLFNSISNKHELSNNNGEVVESSIVVDTNQHSCFDDKNAIECGQSYYGQDAQYQGTEPNYQDNGDGTITDLNTGLMWTQAAGDKKIYSEATSVNGLSFAGYNDWRVPTIKELYSLMDFGGLDVNPTASTASNPFINTSVFEFKYGDTNAGDRIIDSQWVTNTIDVSPVMNNQECFFGVNFADGRIKCYPTQMKKTYYARYVRGNTEYGENKFTDNKDGTITDSSSGMTWQQSDSGKGMIWSDALNYCENLSLASKDDWRLPNAKELQYIVDYSRSPDTTKSPAIDPVFKTSIIVNEMGEDDYPFFWTSTTHKSEASGYGNAVYIGFGKCIGEMNGQVMDVHGAGCQRSDPKTGNQSDYPTLGNGPQGDVRRVFNYVRCVRGGASFTTNTQMTTNSNTSNNTAPSQTRAPSSGGTPPQEAITACSSLSSGSSCSITGPNGTINGTCQTTPGGTLACIPNK